MAGIYVHIPFCRSRCVYCDFFSTTREAEQEAYVRTVMAEATRRRAELGGECVRTVYVGGGTPSLLRPALLRQLLEHLRATFDVAPDAEVTVEMNPDDLPAHAALLASPLLFNRVSLGIQTFDDGLLRLLRRRHDARGALDAVARLQAAGIANISIDLIYGLPGQTMAQWEHDLDVAFGLGVQHLSAYALSYEEGTLLTRWRDEGRIRETAEETSVEMYGRLCRRAADAGFEHYEISNFALPGYHSRHNSNYWTGEAYLGLGAGAHSYDGQRTRRANRPELLTYASVDEVLSDDELYDEAVMCGLRTRQGVDLDRVASRFGEQRRAYLLRMADPHLRAGRLVVSRGCLRLTQQSLMTSDDIMSDLMA